MIRAQRARRRGVRDAQEPEGDRELGSAQDLRARLFQRLKQLDTRSAELTQSLIEARTQRSELEVRLQEALEHIDLTPKPA